MLYCVFIIPKVYYSEHSSLRISTWRTKPLRGRNKGWCEAPFFYLIPVQFGVKLFVLLSFGNLYGKVPDWNPIDNLFYSRSGSVLHASIQNWINTVNSHVCQLYHNFGLTLIRSIHVDQSAQRKMKTSYLFWIVEELALLCWPKHAPDHGNSKTWFCL